MRGGGRCGYGGFVCMVDRLSEWAVDHSSALLEVTVKHLVTVLPQELSRSYYYIHAGVLFLYFILSASIDQEIMQSESVPTSRMLGDDRRAIEWPTLRCIHCEYCIKEGIPPFKRL